QPSQVRWRHGASRQRPPVIARLLHQPPLGPGKRLQRRWNGCLLDRSAHSTAICLHREESTEAPHRSSCRHTGHLLVRAHGTP
ncbi:GIMAP4, partial [Symbiodinium sp. CCMP2456]